MLPISKSIKEKNGIQTVLKDVKDSSGWALCIGAGTSMPVLPDGFSLVEKLINKNFVITDVIMMVVGFRETKKNIEQLNKALEDFSSN